MNNGQTFNFDLDETDMDMITSQETKFKNYNTPSNIKSIDNTSTSNSRRISQIGHNNSLINTHTQLHNTKWGKK